MIKALFNCEDDFYRVTLCHEDYKKYKIISLASNTFYIGDICTIRSIDENIFSERLNISNLIFFINLLFSKNMTRNMFFRLMFGFEDPINTNQRLRNF